MDLNLTKIALTYGFCFKGQSQIYFIKWSIKNI
jgi:hypothetical protein